MKGGINKMEDINKELEEIFSKYPKLDRIDKTLLKIIYKNLSLTRTQIKNRLLNEILSEAQTNFDEKISKLASMDLIEDAEVETKLKVIRKKN